MATDPPPRPAPRTPLSGGIALAIGPIAGAFIGNAQGQPSLGFVLGLAAGLVCAGAVWAIDRTRR